MEKITVDELVKKLGTRYGLVSLVGKRAQQILMESDKSMKASEIIKKVFGEIVNDKIRIKKESADESKQSEPKEVEKNVRKVSRREKD